MNICWNLSLMYDRFSGFIKFLFSERNAENTMSHLYFNEESDYSEENTCDREVFCSTIEKNETCSCLSYLFITYSIRIGNPDWCKCGYCKNKAKERDCLCCREVNAMLIASTKISECKGSISSCSFYGHLLNY